MWKLFFGLKMYFFYWKPKPMLFLWKITSIRYLRHVQYIHQNWLTFNICEQCGKCVWFRDRCRSRFVWKILLNKNEEFDSTWFERWCHAQSTTHIFFIIYLLLHGDSANKNCVKSASETTTASNCINKNNCIFATTR